MVAQRRRRSRAATQRVPQRVPGQAGIATVGGATATPKHSSRRPTRTGGTVRGQGQLGGTPIQNQKAMAFILENGIPWTRHLCDLAEQAQAARSG